MKTIERAHLPSQLWEKIELSHNLKKALEQIDQHLMYWPAKMILKVKQRYTKILQYLIRMRKLRKKLRAKIVGINKKVERRERSREYRALAAASIESQIKKELLERLSQGTYGEIYNFAPESFNEALDEQAYADEIEDEEEFIYDENEDDFIADEEVDDIEDYAMYSQSSEEESEEEDFDNDFKEEEKKEKKRVRFNLGDDDENIVKLPKKKSKKPRRMFSLIIFYKEILRLTHF